MVLAKAGFDRQAEPIPLVDLIAVQFGLSEITPTTHDAADSGGE
jgi:hypothetical protein